MEELGNADAMMNKKFKKDYENEESSPRPCEDENGVAESKFEFSKEPSLETLRRRTAEFASERDWNQYHTPRNLLLG